jgi:hypothetical protein
MYVTLYSDCHRRFITDFYQVKHEKIGRIEVDLSSLKGTIQPTVSENGQGYYKIEFDIVFRVTGRNLEYMAVYPPGGGIDKIVEGSKGFTSISSALPLGMD